MLARFWAALVRKPLRIECPAYRCVFRARKASDSQHAVKCWTNYQHALEEARDRATQFGIVDDRKEIAAHWRGAHSWFFPPIIVAGDLLGSNVGYALLVGFTRLGNLLGLLDRQGVSEVQKHLVWVGREMKRSCQAHSGWCRPTSGC